jgi:neutral amino acid transport system permease protein
LTIRSPRSRPRALRAALALGAGLIFATLLGVAPATASTPEPAPAASESAPSTGFSVGGTISNGDEPVEGAEILVEGDGFSEVAVTDADGAWRVDVPALGAYTSTLDVETLPEGVAPRDPDNVTRTSNLNTTPNANVLFPMGESTIQGTSMWDTVLTRLIYGLNFGLMLALAAIGISLIFGTTGLNNFAHGELLTFGALISFFLTAVLGWSIWAAIAVTLVASAAFGWFHDAAIFKPLRRRRVGLVQAMIVTIGLSIVLRYVFLMIFGGRTEFIQTGFNQVVPVGPANLQLSSILSMVISVVVLIGVGLFLTRTRIGKATRAVSDNAALAAASGIDVDRIIRIVWVLGATLTGLSGILYGVFRGVSWIMGFQILLLLFAAVTLGGLGSAFGALVGALIIGLVTELSTLWLPADLRFATALIILILILLLRPQGILGRRERIG